MVIFNRSRCYNGGNKHKFESRFNKSIPIIDKQLATALAAHFPQLDPYVGINNMLYNMASMEYVYDICVWCGKTIRK